MSWNADAFFAIGKTHMVCQDYARAGRDAEGRPYIVLSDGCSSSPDTDFGARLLCAAAERRLHILGVLNESISMHEHEILERADHAAGTLGMPRRCLDATLLTACFGQNQEGELGVRVSLRGDGVVAVRTRDGHFTLHQIEHLRGAPFYLSYDMEPQRRAAYREEFGDVARSRVYSSHDGWMGKSTAEFHGRADDWFFRAKDYDLVVLMSDGATSFQRAVETNTSVSFKTVSVEEVVAQVLDLKGFAGSFVQRRCHKFLTKFCVQEGWQHSDDFSVAAIWMGDQNDGTR
jgi:hypothetical protein